jgi:membrane-bound serine protease (ClpP class)
MEALLTPLLADPTLLYIMLLMGLWIAITAAHIPGTGVIELAAFGLIGLSLFALIQLPTNWLAMMVMVGGAGCFLVLPYLSPRYAHLAELGLVLQAVGGLTLFTDRTVYLPVLGVTLLLSWLYSRFVLLPILRKAREKTDYHRYTEVVGAVGRVVKEIDPTGTVMVNGEIWSARSIQAIPPNTEVIVQSQRGLELTVEKAKRSEASSPHMTQ